MSIFLEHHKYAKCDKCKTRACINKIKYKTLCMAAKSNYALIIAKKIDDYFANISPNAMINVNMLVDFCLYAGINDEDLKDESVMGMLKVLADIDINNIKSAKINGDTLYFELKEYYNNFFAKNTKPTIKFIDTTDDFKL